MRLSISRLTFILLVLALAGSTGARRIDAGPAIVFVNGAATGANNGTSWADAYKRLSTAIGSSPVGAEIWVAAGTYKPTTSTFREVSFSPKEGQKVFGGFAGTETEREQRNVETNVTTLSGDIGTADLTADNSYHVISFSAATTAATLVDGIIVEDGSAFGPGFAFTAGGGIYGASGAAPTLANLIVRLNTAAQFGGGAFVAGNATLANVTFAQNAAPTGAGLTVFGGDVTLVAPVFEENVASGAGGGLAAWAGRAEVSGGAFHRNRAKNGGGAFVNAPAILEIDGSRFLANRADVSGGGLLSVGAVTVASTEFLANRASEGGGVRIGGGTPVFGEQVVFTRNVALDQGGGISLNASIAVQLNGVQFVENTGTDGGGAIHSVNADVSIVDSTFIHNSVSEGGSEGRGGAIRSALGDLVIAESKFVLNAVGARGGAVHVDSGSLSVTESVFDRNEANVEDGGAIYVGHFDGLTPASVTGSTFSGNHAKEDGGAIYYDFVGMAASEGLLVVGDSTFTGNFAESGGAIASLEPVQISGSLLSENEAQEGGAVWGITAVVSDTRFIENRGAPGTETAGAALYIDRDVSLTNVEFRDNVATPSPSSAGGAVFAYIVRAEGVAFEGNKGAPALSIGPIGGSDTESSLRNVTFSDNEGGAIRMSGQALTLNNVTIAENTSGEHGAIEREFGPGVDAQLRIRNSILWDNGTEAVEAVAGDTIDLSVIEGGCPAGASCAGIVAMDPLLKPLADKGGFTRTHGLTLGSPAIDAADNDTCEPSDQRGADRPIDGDGNGSKICDMGAYEVGPTSISFAGATSAVSEGSRKASIRVVLGAALIDEATVQYRVTGGSATNGKDFVLANGRLTFAPGDTSEAIAVTIRGDLFVEPRETVIVELESPTNALLGPAKHTLTIADDERRLKCDGKPATIVGTGATDVIIGTSARDVVVALGGADTVNTRGGGDLVCAGGGSDTVDGGGGKDIVRGDGGNDTLRGGGGRDVVRGGGGADQLRGGSGNDDLLGDGGTDQLFGEGGKDRLAGGNGAGDRCDGGPGADTLFPAADCEVVVGVP